MKKEVNIFDCIVLLVVLLMILLAACNSTKQVSKQTTTVDSSHVKELSDSIRLLKTENEKLIADIREMQYGSVIFDTVYMPGDTIVNTVTITKEGEIKASGRVSAAYVSKSVLTKIVNEKQRVIDSLSQVKQRETVKLVTRTEYKDKFVKRSFMAGWWLWILFFLAGVYVGWRWRKFIHIVDKI